MLRLPPIEFQAPRRLVEVLATLAGEDVRLVAGGTDLWPNLKRRQHQARRIVSLMSVPQLHGVTEGPGEWRLGAATTLGELTAHADLRDRYPALVRALAAIASPPLRNLGTLGGNLCLDTRCGYYNQSLEWRRAIGYCLKECGETCWVATRSPRCWAQSASDSAPLLWALGARVKLVSSAGERVLPLGDLYRDDGIDHLNLRHDEVLTEVLLPAASDSAHCRATYWKLRRRGSIDFPVFSVAAALWMDTAGGIRRASLVLGAVGSAPLAVAAAESLAGEAPDADRIDAVAHAARKLATPMDTGDYTPAWRGQMVEHYSRGALRELAGLPVPGFTPSHGLVLA